MANINTIKLDDTEEIALEKFVHTPYQSGQALIKLAEQLYGTEGISLGTPLLDYFIPPTRPHWTRVMIARPGELKSTWLRIMAKIEAQKNNDNGWNDKCVVIVTYEAGIDTQELYFTDLDKEKFWKGMLEPETVQVSVNRRQELKIFWIGESSLKTSVTDARMSPNMVMAGISAIKKAYGMAPSLVLWDYIQETQVDRASLDRKQKIIDAMGDVIRMCDLLAIPFEVASQAKQTSLERLPWPIPEKGDSEYSFYPEQKGSTAVGSWRVWETHRDNENVQRNGIKLQGWKEPFEMHPNLTILRSSKARYGKQRMAVPALVDPVAMTVSDLPKARWQLER